MMKKLMCLGLCICSLFLLSFNVSAASVPSESNNLAPYQAVMNKINAEYGLNYHFPSKAELSKANLSNPDTFDANTVTVAQFENALQKVAESQSQENAQAKSSWNTALKKSATDDSLNTVESIEPMDASRDLTKAITGGTAEFLGIESDSGGYWRWTFFQSTNVITDYNSDTARFFLSDYNYSFIDAHRTCAVNYIGTLYNKILAWWIPSDSTQYVEWYA
jgi:hypothetical protein